MKGLYTWASSTISTAYTGALNFASACVSGAKAFYESGASIRATGRRYFIQFWSGYTRVLDPQTVTTIASSDKAQAIFGQSLSANLLYYAAPVILYGAVIKPGLQCIPGYEYAEGVVDAAATIYFIHRAARMYVDNTAYNLALTKAINDEYPAQSPFDTCGCEPIEALKGSFASSFYYVINRASIYTVSNLIPYVGPYVDSTLSAFLYGQSLVEYKLSGMCATHRYELLAKNNTYSFGMGLSLVSLTYLLRTVVKSTTGVDNWFVYDALFCLAYQYFITANLLTEKPLPGERQSIDAFYHSRLITDSLMTQTAQDIIPAIWSAEDQQYWIVDKLKELYQVPNVRKAMNSLRDVVIDKDFQSLDEFIKRPAIKLYFDTYESSYKAALSRINGLREDNKLAWVAYLPNFVVNKKTKKLLSVIRSPDLDNTVNTVNTFFAKVYPKMVDEFEVLNKNHRDRMQELARVQNQSVPPMLSLSSRAQSVQDITLKDKQEEEKKGAEEPTIEGRLAMLAKDKAEDKKIEEKSQPKLPFLSSNRQESDSNMQLIQRFRRPNVNQ